MVSDEMVGAFRQQNRALPPWRTRQAMLSKWSPAELAALAAQLAGMARPAAQQAQLQQQQAQAPATPPLRPSSAPGECSPLHAAAHPSDLQQQQHNPRQWGFQGLVAPAQPPPLSRAPRGAEAPAGPVADSDSCGSPCSTTSLSSADFMPQPVPALGGRPPEAAAAAAPAGRQPPPQPPPQRGRKQKSMLALALKNASGAGGAPASSTAGSSASGSSAGGGQGAKPGANFIRTLEEPWARITTVRWGAYAAQAAKPAVRAIS